MKKLEFNWRMGDYGLKACPERLVRFEDDEENKTINFLRYYKYQGKEAGEIRLMLPIQVKDVVNEYTFVFKVYYTYDHPELLKTERL